MASKKYRFVSPGVQLRELDRSQIPDEPEAIGPVIIGRAERGPALQPVKVQNFTEFVQIFGNPSPGGKVNDVWREGNESLSPQYGAYAAQAWLTNSTPITFIRLLGRSHLDNNGTDAALAGWKVGTNGISETGGAFGLFLVDSGSTATDAVTGTLAAVWYTTADYHIGLSGTSVNGQTVSGTAVMVRNNGASANGGQFLATLTSNATGEVERFEFNFDSTSDKFIRKVFNTNPTKLNSNLYSSTEKYFLGETFESSVQSTITSGSAANTVHGVILGMHGGAAFDVDYNVNQIDSNPASTGWIVSQDTGEAGSFNTEQAKKLFKVIALEHGAWSNANIKISIEDIRYSDDPAEEYGSFSLVIRSTKDKDSAPIVLESFSNLNLNPDSPNYIAARIGNQYARWSDTDRRWRYFGEYENSSKYIYIEEYPGLGDDPSLLPFGYQGPVRPVGLKAVSGSLASRGELLATVDKTGTGNVSSIPLGGNTLDGRNTSGGSSKDFINGMEINQTASFIFPATKLRTNTKQGNLSAPTDAYFGVDTVKSNGRYDNSYADLTRGIPGAQGHGEFGPVTTLVTTGSEFSYVFTLDNVSHFTSSTSTDLDQYEAYYVSGSRVSGKSISASGSLETGANNGYKSVIDDGYDQFTIPMHGGFDGIDITQTEPFNNDAMKSPATQITSYAYNTVGIAIDTCADPENVDMNILSAPGVTVPGLTDRVIDVCESRGDALGIIDIEKGFVPAADRSTPGEDYDTNNRGDATTAARNFKARQINNSYGAAYYPWTKVRDSETGKTFFCPPSVAAIGTLSYSQAVSEVWFAPAGFNRGGLTAGAAGVPVVGVTEKLSSKERDKLYEANINPIASFPSEGLVVFGQKTLQTTRSALDRINVRRLLIFIKKEISRISNGLLFDPNTQVTWDRFTGQAVPFLESVKSRLGLEDYKVVLDTTTTTPDLIDRNVMYAKIFLKPTRAIEFIAVDFVITNTGASFED
jgi:hypothetical protein